MLAAHGADGELQINLLVWDTTLPRSFAHSGNLDAQQEYHYQSGNVSVFIILSKLIQGLVRPFLFFSLLLED